MFQRIYWFFSYLGVMTLSASFIMGFRYLPGAPAYNLLFNLLLYLVFIVVHIIMTTPKFKNLFYGVPEGSPPERRIYIVISVVTWIVVYWLHKPMGGFGLLSPSWLQFIGLCAVLLSVFAFFEFATFDLLGGLLGVHEQDLSHSVGAESPLMTEGPYANVRHPMYRAAFFIAFSSLLIHPNTGQLFFAILVSSSFIGFIPFEEYQLLNAREEEYREYIKKTPYRLFKGIW